MKLQVLYGMDQATPLTYLRPDIVVQFIRAEEKKAISIRWAYLARTVKPSCVLPSLSL